MSSFGERIIRKLRNFCDTMRVDSFRRLAARGYHVHVVFSPTKTECYLITGGDPNCSHKKYYDPADGHGYTHVHMDDVPDLLLDELDGEDEQTVCDEVFLWMESKVIQSEGKAKGE